MLSPYHVEVGAAAALAPDGDDLAPRVTAGSFTAAQLAQIYAYPPPPADRDVTVGILSFGGGLVGTFSGNVLQTGDVPTYLAQQDIPSGSRPTVALVLLGGATNNLTDTSSTLENTLDVACVASTCPSARLTVILYILPNSLANMAYGVQYAASTPVTVNGVARLPSVLSISWGLPEIVTSAGNLASINAALAFAAAQGITVCVAAGDHGSSDRVPGATSNLPGQNVDFPASSPYSLACGGTTLVCPNLVYDSSTVETAWTSGGGGVSRVFDKPSYQASLPGSTRLVPDVALVADPATPLAFLLYGLPKTVGGTSVAAPLMAGFLAAVDYRAFANPALYALGFGAPHFHDVLTGSNGAYAAAVGHDLCTGLGSVAGASLAPALSSLAVTGVVVSPTSASLAVGAQLAATAAVRPASAQNTAVVWGTSNPAVATVSSSGVITAASVGACSITVTTVEGGFVAALALTVVASNVAATSVTVTPSSQTSLAVGAQLAASATVYPRNATNQTVSWSSTEPGVASVDAASGRIVALAPGTCAIVVTTSDGGRQASFVLVVTQAVVPSTSVTVAPASAQLAVGDSLDAVASVLPSNVTNASVTWSTSNAAVARVSSSGRVTAWGAGSCVVTARNGASAGTLLLTVTTDPIAATGLAVSPTVAQVYAGDALQAAALVLPPNATDKTVTWSSSAPAVAQVGASTGLVQALTAGTSTIAAATALANGAFQASFLLTVLPTPAPVTGVSVPPPSLPLLATGADLQLQATVSPPDATNPAVIWSSSDANVAVVSVGDVAPSAVGDGVSSAVVRAVGSGTCLIIATTVNGSFSSSFELTVEASVVPAASLALAPPSLALELGAYRRVVAVVQPSDATTPTLFYSNNEAIATVSAKGVVHAVGVGSCVLRAENGALVATSAVRVVPRTPPQACGCRRQDAAPSWFTRRRG
jgi:uncharacterized protein YjdB